MRIRYENYVAQLFTAWPWLTLLGAVLAGCSDMPHVLSHAPSLVCVFLNLVSLFPACRSWLGHAPLPRLLTPPTPMHSHVLHVPVRWGRLLNNDHT